MRNYQSPDVGKPRAAPASGWSGAQAGEGLQEHGFGAFRILPVFRMCHVNPMRDDRFVQRRVVPLSLLDMKPMKLQRHLQGGNRVRQ